MEGKKEKRVLPEQGPKYVKKRPASEQEYDKREKQEDKSGGCDGIDEREREREREREVPSRQEER